MSRDLSSSVLSSLDKEVMNPFFAVELLFDDTPLRMWTGLNELVYGGQTFYGSGNLLEVSSVDETSDISAKGATLSLSGIPSEVLSTALSTPYQGRLCKIYFGVFSYGRLLLEDSTYLLMEDGSKVPLELQETGLTEIFSGFMDQMNIEEGAGSSSVSLAVENKLIDLERSRVRRFTSSYQKSQYPLDLGLDFVESLQTKEIFWGKKGA